ncbi:MAG TPA: hypothetical protein VGG94_02005, partial [Chthoniobacterales bacterium]
LIDRFVYLRVGLAILLAFVGAKMILADSLPIPNWLSLAVIVLVLSATIVASLIATRHREAASPQK